MSGSINRPGGRNKVRILLCLALVLSIMLSWGIEADPAPVEEQCGKWTVSFNWSDPDGYIKSISHTDNEAGGVRVSTDTLNIKSNTDPGKTAKISIMKYAKWDSSLAFRSNLMKMANNTLKLSFCKDVRLSDREIDGKPGIFAAGTDCKSSKMVYAAVYPIDGSVDGSSMAVTTSALGVILSTYDKDSALRLIDSIHIE